MHLCVLGVGKQLNLHVVDGKKLAGGSDCRFCFFFCCAAAAAAATAVVVIVTESVEDGYI